MFFRCLGWAYAIDGEKASSFAERFSALGNSTNLEKFEAGCIEFSNTELVKSIDRILAQGSLDSKEAQTWRGRMQFADNQLFGKLCLSAVTDHVFRSSSNKLFNVCIDALERFKLSLHIFAV